jgi:large subunit ribosomal protein L10
MAKNKKQKKELLDKYKGMISNSKGMVIVKARKVTPNQVNEFKKSLSDMNSEFHVVKNTIFKIALKDNNLAEIEDLEFGEHAALFFGEDFVNPAKMLKKFIEDSKEDKDKFKVEVVAGFLGTEFLDKAQATELAEIPSKEQSISMILGILENAMSGIVNVLEDAPRSFVTILDQAFKE